MFGSGNSGRQGAPLPSDLGFAESRVNFHTDLSPDVVVFWVPVTFALSLLTGNTACRRAVWQLIAAWIGLKNFPTMSAPGWSGRPGQKRSHYSVRFVVDFAGGDLQLLGPNAKLLPVISASSDEVEVTPARPLVAVQDNRVTFDLKPTAANVAPIDLRVFLTMVGQPLSENWLHQWTPPAVAEREF